MGSYPLEFLRLVAFFETLGLMNCVKRLLARFHSVCFVWDSTASVRPGFAYLELHSVDFGSLLFKRTTTISSI